jgi:microcystin-dependent protein
MTTKVSLIADSSVTGATINDLTITTDDIANNTVTTSKIDFGTALVPLGGIIMWSGTTIPTGWALCNGSNGTPNLQDRFIVGAGSDRYAVGATGGSANATLVSHNHTGTTGGVSVDHYHIFPGDDQLAFANGVAGWSALSNGSFGYDAVSGNRGGGQLWRTSGISENHVHGFGTSAEGSSATNANLPPYYALAFIMRVL